MEDGFGNDTIAGGEGGTDSDTIDLSALTTGVTVTYSGTEVGTITDGTDTISFSEIESIDGSNQNDSLDAATDAGGATLIAHGGDDTIVGSTGADSISGGDGNDFIYSSDGADTIDGGGWYDYMTYVGSGSAVTIDMSDGLAEVGGEAQGDVLTNINQVIGSTFADTFTAAASGVRFLGRPWQRHVHRWRRR